MSLNCRQTKRLFATVAILATLALPCGAKDRIIVEDGDTIAFLGDSITAGGAGHGGYCRLVIHGLKTRGINARGLFAGIPGNKSSDMLLRLGGVLKQKPDHLFLSVGVNDIWHADHTVKIGVFQAKPGMGVHLEHYKVYVPQILDRCKDAGTDVILSTITPITEDPEFKLNKTSEKYNAFLYEQAKKRDLPIARLNEEMFARIAEVHAEEGANGRNVLTGDGVHPTAPGNQMMAKGVLKAMGFSDKDLRALEKEWNSSPKILILGDRQVNAGGRAGGWVNMLLDGLNISREMVTAARVTDRKALTLGALVPKLNAAFEKGRTKYMLVVPPLGDFDEETPADEYKKTVEAVVEFAEKNKLKLVITTIPMLNSDPDSDANVNFRTYDSVIRDVCRKKKVALADISMAMRENFKKHPGARLTLSDERLNHEGGKLLAAAVLAAFDIDADKVDDLREAWDQRASYTFRYGGRVSSSISLSAAGVKALQEITDRFHRLDSGKFLDLGVFLLLEGDDGENEKRIACFDKEWLSAGDGGESASFRADAGSAARLRAIDAYLKKHEIDRVEFYIRAYKVGMYVMRKEDPLGRGSY